MGAVLTLSIIILTMIIVIYMQGIFIGLDFLPKLGTLMRVLQVMIST